MWPQGPSTLQREPGRKCPLEFRDSDFGSRFGISGVGLRGSGFGFRVSGFRIQDSGFGLQVSGFGFEVSGLAFRVSGFGFRVSVLGFGYLGLRARNRVADADLQTLRLGIRV